MRTKEDGGLGLPVGSAVELSDGLGSVVSGTCATPGLDTLAAQYPQSVLETKQNTVFNSNV